MSARVDDEPRSGGLAPVILEPIDFRRRLDVTRAKRRVARWIVILLGAVASLAVGAGAWFVLTATEVTLEIDPVPDSLEFTGSALHLEWRDRLLCRPGTFHVRAARSGYYPIDESIIVTAGDAHRFAFSFDELPGVVTVRCHGADAPAAPLDGVVLTVDGARIGPTPVDEIPIDSGTHAIRLEAERYQVMEASIEVTGRGEAQTFEFELRPDWARVEIASAPAATVWLDGKQVASTPCALDVRSGPHELELRAEGYTTWHHSLVVVAERPVALPDIRLTPAPGLVRVVTEPEGAQVIIGGVYAGTSPVDVPVDPNRDHRVQLALVGYEPAERSVRVGPEETETVRIVMAAQYGRVHFDLEPADATVVLNGRALDPAPERLDLLAVEHTIQVVRDGYAPVERVVRPRPGVPERVIVRLEPLGLTGPDGAPTEGPPQAGNGYPFVRIGSATFMMGASRREQGRRSNETLRAIELKRNVLFGAREVTNDEYRAFEPAHESGVFDTVSLNGGDRPAVRVTWDDAARFCNWLSAQDGLPPAYVEADGAMRPVAPMSIGYRLPTEAEWAYAARAVDGGEPLKFPWGATFPPKKASGNYADESASPTLGLTITGYRDGHVGPAPVASFAANAFGIFDLGGNVSEWCHDFYTTYTYNPRETYADPMGPVRGRHHVVRGSSWRHASISTLRLAYRDYWDDARDDLGFRVCRYLTSDQ